MDLSNIRKKGPEIVIVVNTNTNQFKNSLTLFSNSFSLVVNQKSGWKKWSRNTTRRYERWIRVWKLMDPLSDKPS